eukprot:7237997-Heterocapsa_arctica.AAC.1
MDGVQHWMDGAELGMGGAPHEDDMAIVGRSLGLSLCGAGMGGAEHGMTLCVRRINTRVCFE